MGCFFSTLQTNTIGLRHPLDGSIYTNKILLWVDFCIA